MKKMLGIVLIGTLFLCAQAAGSAWQATCLPQQKECRSLWATLPVSGNSNIVIAYTAVKNNKQYDAAFTINLNGITLAPQQNAVSLSGDRGNTVSIPVVAKDATGTTLQFTNPVAVNQILQLLSTSKSAILSFMEANTENLTTVTIPLEGFNEQLAKVPHGDQLFLKR